MELHGKDAQIVVISRFGLIPKRGQPGQWRLIQDLSHPPGHSINDGIDKDLCSLVYVTVDIAIEQITKLGQGSRLAKIDIQHAYHIIPIHPQDRPLIGMQFEGRVFLDTTLPFGLRSAPKIFTAVADALEWVLRDQGDRWIMHYLDDYLTIGSPESEECQHNMAVMSECCRRLGVPLKLEKMEGPTTCLEFLGITLDTCRMEARLSEARVEALMSELDRQARRRCRKRELLSLISQLAHTCKIVRVGRIFLRRLISLATRAKRLYHWLHMSQDVGWT